MNIGVECNGGSKPPLISAVATITSPTGTVALVLADMYNNDLTTNTQSTLYTLSRAAKDSYLAVVMENLYSVCY